MKTNTQDAPVDQPDAWTRTSLPDLQAQFAAELAARRAEAHRGVDQMYDAFADRQALDFEMLRRDLAGKPEH